MVYIKCFYLLKSLPRTDNLSWRTGSSSGSPRYPITQPVLRRKRSGWYRLGRANPPYFHKAVVKGSTPTKIVSPCSAEAPRRGRHPTNVRRRYNNPLLPMPCGGEGSRYVFIQKSAALFPNLKGSIFISGLILRFHVDTIFWDRRYIF